MADETKMVQVTLGALIRMEYVETLRVPADITEGELAELGGLRYAQTDGGEFSQDPDYWERGECHATQIDGDPPVRTSGWMVRQADGSLKYVEDVGSDALDGERSTAVAAIEDNAAQAHALGQLKLNPYKSYGGEDSTEFKAYETGWYREFSTWCDEVNKLADERWSEINAQPGLLCKGVHDPYPKAMLVLYFDEGHSAQEAHETIAGNNDSGRAEAIAS